eukprot:scpid86985/ scgid5085/ 
MAESAAGDSSPSSQSPRKRRLTTKENRLFEILFLPDDGSSATEFRGFFSQDLGLQAYRSPSGCDTGQDSRPGSPLLDNTAWFNAREKEQHQSNESVCRSRRSQPEPVLAKKRSGRVVKTTAKMQELLDTSPIERFSNMSRSFHDGLSGESLLRAEFRSTLHSPVAAPSGGVSSSVGAGSAMSSPARSGTVSRSSSKSSVSVAASRSNTAVSTPASGSVSASSSTSAVSTSASVSASSSRSSATAVSTSASAAASITSRSRQPTVSAAVTPVASSTATVTATASRDEPRRRHSSADGGRRRQRHRHGMSVFRARRRARRATDGDRAALPRKPRDRGRSRVRRTDFTRPAPAEGVMRRLRPRLESETGDNEAAVAVGSDIKTEAGVPSTTSALRRKQAAPQQQPQQQQ